jgi:hypothetical protein
MLRASRRMMVLRKGAKMKYLASFALTLVFAAVSFGQIPKTETDPPGIDVVKISWSKNVQRPDLSRDTAGPVFDNRDPMQKEKEIFLSQITAKMPGGNDGPKENPNRRSSGQAAPEAIDPTKTKDQYIYNLKIKNGGDKTIKSVQWTYLFLDKVTNEEVGRHEFHSVTKLGPKSSKTISEAVLSPPTRVVSAGKPGTDYHNAYTEKAVISRVEFSDGSSWQREVK